MLECVAVSVALGLLDLVIKFGFAPCEICFCPSTRALLAITLRDILRFFEFAATLFCHDCFLSQLGVNKVRTIRRGDEAQ